MSTPTPTETLLRRRFEPHEEIPVAHPEKGCVLVWECVGYVPWRGGIIEQVRLLRTEPMPKGVRL